MPVPKVKAESEPISEVQKVTTITNPVGTKDVAGTQIDPASMAGTPTLYNVTMTNADTEYSQALPANTKKFLIHTQDGTAFRIAFVTGKVATPTAPYFTVLANDAYYEDGIKASITLYFGCASAGKIVEIIAWS